MRTYNTEIFDGYDLSTSFESDGYSLEHACLFSITATVSGGSSPTGSFYVQASNDKEKSSSMTWITLTTSNSSFDSERAITDNGSVLWDYPDCGYRWVRVTYTRSSGDGSCTVRINTKGY